ncbi:MAG: ABC transporter substrate-binding protein [Pseudorhodoplanes sp.]|nr:ABC transporter substrate-binding protein [Pseudorhodoplanes sp.]GIK80302.1 MAG: ABC transporter substrate-binding protein [Alphaproteobacteria bacterium]
MRNLTRRTFVAGTASAIGFPGLAFAQGANTKVRFAVDWVWQGNHSIWTYGVDQGLFAKEKVDASIERGYGSADNLNKLAAGALDIALVDPNLLAKFNNENPNAQMNAVCVMYDAAPSAVTFLKSSGIKTVKDLEGKKLAVTETDASWPLFRVVCEVNKIDLGKIEVVNVSPQLRDSMIIQKRVDASLGFFVTSVINIAAAGIPRDDIGYIQYNNAGLQLYSLSLTCRKDYAAKNPAAVSGFIRGTIAGTRAMLANKKAAVETLLKRDPLLKVDIESDRNDLIINGSLLTPWVRQHGLSTVDRERFERTGAQVAKAFGLSITPKMEDIYTDKFLPPQADRKLV